jgi:CRP-like cAMP-binding protein
MSINLFITHISKHITLNTEEIAILAEHLKYKEFKRNAFLLHENEVCKCLTFVISGCVKVYSTNNKGNEHVIDFCIEEWWADDLYSLLTHTQSKFNIKAIENTQVLQISKNNLELLYQKIPKLEKFFRILFQNAYIAQREQINITVSTSAEERYQLFLAKKPYANKRFSQKDIASYLGVTPQFFSTMKKQLKLM